MSAPATASSGLAALLSLSQAAASAQPVPIPVKNDGSTLSRGPVLKHRRLSSTGQTRRRLSEARDAVSRPSPASLHSAASAFASLSLASNTSASPPVHIPITAATSATGPRAVPIPIRSSPRTDVLAKSVPTQLGFSEQDVDVDVEDDDDKGNDKAKSGKGGKGSGKKRGTIFRCESCSKVYRHPSCLVKHRWEHSPHWREASKFLLSKHQQVQLLEAAAILSHLSPGTSLPEDRSLWPSYLSGGLLPPPSITTTPLTVLGTTAQQTSVSSTTDLQSSGNGVAIVPTSSSVPATTTSPLMTRARSGSVSTSVSSAGPRMHDYRLPGGGSTGITQIRPGLLGHATGLGTSAPGVMTPYESDPLSANDDVADVPASVSSDSPVANGTAPMAVPANGHSTHGYATWGEHRSAGAHSHSFTPSSLSHSVGTGGWSLPRSDIRSGSVVSYSESRSRSGSRSDEEDSSDEIDPDIMDDSSAAEGYAFGYGFSGRNRGRGAWKNDEDDMSVGLPAREESVGNAKKEEEEEWDGMDMDMEL